MRNLYIVVLLLVSITATARAQTVSLITFGPGELTFEKFGHTALRIREEKTGLDVMYNWGLFAAKNEAELITRFINGRLEYWMEGFDGAGTIDLYRQAGRAIWEQELNLTPEQAMDMIRFLAWNEQPENRYYRYDYYRDNCTTRVRDVIDKAAGGAIARSTKGVPTGTSYRDHTRRTLASDVPLYTALQEVLGPWVDRKIDAWEESFLPFELQRHIRSVMVTDAAGKQVPLVKSETELAAGRFAMPSTTVPTYWPFYGLAGLAIGGLMVGLSAFASRHGIGRLAMLSSISTWAMLGGIGGGIMLFGWLYTDHVVSYRNENLLQTSPLLLILPLLTFMATVGTKWARRSAAWLAMFVAALSVIGLLLKALPWFRQVNWDIIALAVPVNLGMAWALWRFAKTKKDQPRSHEGTKQLQSAQDRLR